MKGRLSSLKLIILLGIYQLTLSACANYAGIHPQTHMLTEQQLITAKNTINNNWPTQAWWLDFHDPYLNQLISQGLKTQPNIQLAQARVRLAAQMANAAQANSLPSLSGQANAAEQIFSQNYIYPPPIGGVWSPFYNLDLTFNYEFDFWHKNQQTLAAALGDMQAAQAQEASAQLILASGIAQAYIQVCGDNSLIKLAQESVSAQNNLLRLNMLEHNAGVISSFPVDQSRQALANEQILLSQLQNHRQIAIHQLSALTAMPIDENNLTQPLIIKSKYSNLPHNLPLNLLSRRPDLMALSLSATAQSHRINAAKAQFYPNINLSAIIGLQSLGLKDLFETGSQYTTIGPAINLPIFDAGRLRANLGITDAQYDIAIDQYNQGLINAIQQTENALSLLHSTSDQQHEQAMQLKAVLKNNQYTKANYLAGTTNALDMMRSNLMVLQTQQQLMQLNIQHQIAIIKIIQALGGGYNAS